MDSSITISAMMKISPLTILTILGQADRKEISFEKHVKRGANFSVILMGDIPVFLAYLTCRVVKECARSCLVFHCTIVLVAGGSQYPFVPHRANKALGEMA